MYSSSIAKPTPHCNTLCAPSERQHPGESERTGADKYALPQAWATYLDNPRWDWNWYGHFTFRDYPHPEAANKRWDLFIHKLNRDSFGVRYYKRQHQGTIWARGTEYQRRGAIHFHAIIGSIAPDVNRFVYMNEWYNLSGIARIYPYERGRGAEYYMSKSTYAWKRGEIDLGGPLEARLDYEELRLPSPIAKL